MNKAILKSKKIKSEAFREYSHLQGYVTSQSVLVIKRFSHILTIISAKTSKNW